MEMIRMHLCPIASAAFLMVVSPAAHAAVFDIRAVADLSNPTLYDLQPESNIAMLHVPLAAPPQRPYDAGDRLNVSITFDGEQRLKLAAHPTGQSAPFGNEMIGVYVADTDIAHLVRGSSTFKVDLIDPIGSALVSSHSGSNSFAAAQGAILRANGNWTDTSFSVAGVSFQIDLLTQSQAVLPDTITLELREFEIQAVPSPASIWLLSPASWLLAATRQRRFVPPC